MSGLASDTGQNEPEPSPLELLRAYCWWVATTQIPCGQLGTEGARDLLEVFPEASRLGMPDSTNSAPHLFGILVECGLLPSLPSDRVMPASLRLLAAASPLATSRSPRRWTAWFASALDPHSPVAAEIRRCVTPAMLQQSGKAPTSTPRRPGSIRADRDRLIDELRVVRNELAGSHQREENLAKANTKAREQISILENTLQDEARRHKSEQSEATTLAASMSTTIENMRAQIERHITEAAECRRLLGIAPGSPHKLIRAEIERWRHAIADAASCRQLLRNAALEREQDQQAAARVVEDWKACVMFLAGLYADMTDKAEQCHRVELAAQAKIGELEKSLRAEKESYQRAIDTHKHEIGVRDRECIDTRHELGVRDRERDDLKRQLADANQRAAGKAFADDRVSQLEAKVNTLKILYDTAKETLAEIRPIVGYEERLGFSETHFVERLAARHTESVNALKIAQKDAGKFEKLLTDERTAHEQAKSSVIRLEQATQDLTAEVDELEAKHGFTASVLSAERETLNGKIRQLRQHRDEARQAYTDVEKQLSSLQEVSSTWLAELELRRSRTFLKPSDEEIRYATAVARNHAQLEISNRRTHAPTFLPDDDE